MISSKTMLTLLNLPGYGKKTVRAALAFLDTELTTPRQVAEFTQTVAAGVKRAKEHTEAAAIEALSLADRALSDSATAGVAVIGWGSNDYPDRLKNIQDPPLVLFVKGDLENLSPEISVALIGTRKPSEFGRKSAYRIGKHLAEAGISVVSGLALGCDAEGHFGCLAAHGKAIAVLAHGLDKVSPAAHRDLADNIVTKGWVIVSEYALGVVARKNHFVERDRLQSGLSDAVIVAETGLKGGTMHTVRFCEEQNRKLACIQHPEKFLGSEFSAGNQALIKNKKAKPLADSEDLERFLNSLSCDSRINSI